MGNYLKMKPIWLIFRSLYIRAVAAPNNARRKFVPPHQDRNWQKPLNFFAKISKKLHLPIRIVQSNFADRCQRWVGCGWLGGIFKRMPLNEKGNISFCDDLLGDISIFALFLLGIMHLRAAQQVELVEGWFLAHANRLRQAQPPAFDGNCVIPKVKEGYLRWVTNRH